MRSTIVLIVALLVAAAAPANAQLIVSPHLDAKVAGDVETERGGVGMSVGYYLRAWRGIGLGLELDAAWHGHFFRDKDVASLVPENVDLNTDALILMGNLVVPVSTHAPCICNLRRLRKAHGRRLICRGQLPHCESSRPCKCCSLTKQTLLSDRVSGHTHVTNLRR